MAVINEINFTPQFLQRHVAGDLAAAQTQANTRCNSGERMANQSTIIISAEDDLAAVVQAAVGDGDIMATDVQRIIDVDIVRFTCNDGVAQLGERQNAQEVTIKGDRTDNVLLVSHLG